MQRKCTETVSGPTDRLTNKTMCPRFFEKGGGHNNKIIFKLVIKYDYKLIMTM